MTHIDDSLQALQDFDPAAHKYLYVCGDGTNQFLEARTVGFLGRIWQWICIKLGCSNASLAKVAAYVAKNAAQLMPPLSSDAAACDRLLDKLVKYDKNHPNQISQNLALIQAALLANQAGNAPPAPPAPPPASPPTFDQALEAFEQWKTTGQEADFKQFLDLLLDPGMMEIHYAYFMPQITCEEIEKAVALGYFAIDFSSLSNATFPTAVDYMDQDRLKALFGCFFESSDLIKQEYDPAISIRCLSITKYLTKKHSNHVSKMLEWLCPYVQTKQYLFALMGQLHQYYDNPLPGPDAEAVWRFTEAYILWDSKRPGADQKAYRLRNTTAVQDMLKMSKYSYLTAFL